MAQRFFTPATFKCLKNLQANNNRVWFDEHKQEYEDAVRTPALDFIAAMADDIADISPTFAPLQKKWGAR